MATVTDQYLQHIEGLSALDPTELNQFIELAAKLIHIKSQVLVPEPGEPEYQEDLQQLTEQLEEYRRYQAAGAYLDSLIRQNQASWSRQAPQPLPDTDKIELPSVTAKQLQAAFASALARVPMVPQQEVTETFTIEQATVRIRQAVEEGSRVELASILQSATTRTEALVLFLSLLELWRTGDVGVLQERPFGAIILIDG